MSIEVFKTGTLRISFDPDAIKGEEALGLVWQHQRMAAELQEKLLILPAKNGLIIIQAGLGSILARLKHWKGRVPTLAFESHPYVYAVLRNTIGENKIHNVDVRNAAIGEESGFTQIATIEEGWQFQELRLDDFGNPLPNPPLQVEQLSLDDAVPPSYTTDVIILNIRGGVGFESLYGAHRLLKRDLPVLFINQPLTEEADVAVMRQYDYEIAGWLDGYDVHVAKASRSRPLVMKLLRLVA